MPPHTEKVFNDYLMFTNFMGDYLPPYSPMLTPIEEAISLIKNEIRTKLNTNDRLKLLNLINVPRGQKKIEQENFLRDAISKSVRILNPEYMQSYINHVNSFYIPVMNMEDI